jgi:hypothetical protein
MGYRGLGELPNPMNQLAQVSQIQQSMRQGQMAEMQYKKALDTEAKLSKYYASIAENGGPKTAKEAEQLMLLSGDSGIQNMGAQTQMLRLQNEQELERFRGAQSPAGGAPMTPSFVPEPGSFGADVAARREADPFARPPERNNMMPGVVAAPARVNNLGGRTIDDMLAERDRMGLLPGKLAANRVKTLTADIALASREPSYQNVPGVGLVNPRDMSVVMPSVESTDPVIKQYNLAVSQGFKGSILDYKREIARAGRAPAAPRPEAAPRTQQVTMRDGTLGIMNMDTGAITPATMGGAPVRGKPSAFAEKNVEQRKQMGINLGFAITQLADITKDGGLIDQSTGSGAGRLTDIAAGFIGEATPGAIAIGKIAPIADLALKMVPRFEGPQSNADTRSYKEAAGQLADPTLPTKIRKEAGKVVLRIMQERKNQFVTSDMAAEGAPSGGNVVDYGELK